MYVSSSSLLISSSDTLWITCPTLTYSISIMSLDLCSFTRKLFPVIKMGVVSLKYNHFPLSHITSLVPPPSVSYSTSPTCATMCPPVASHEGTTSSSSCVRAVGPPPLAQPPPVHTRETLLPSHATVQPHCSPEDSCPQTDSACPDALSVPCTLVSST